MKKQAIIFSLATLFTFLTSCDYDTIQAEGEVTSKQHDITGYSELRVSDTFQVHVIFSDTEEGVRIEANNNLHDKIVVEKDGNQLIIRLKNRTSVKGNATLNAYVTTQNLSTLFVSGASELTLDDAWVIHNGSIYVSGASHVYGEVDADALHTVIDGASTLDLYGNVSSLNAKLYGSSDMRDYDLHIFDLNMELAGASVAFLSVDESIDVSASGASTLNYKGAAVITRSELSGSSKVIHKN
jgi:hypothetical protein